MTRATMPRSRRLQVIGLLLGALVLRALVPAGYMLGGDVQGGLTLTMCHAAGIPPSTLPAEPAAPGEGPRTLDVCSFALSASAAPPPAAAVVPDVLAIGSPATVRGSVAAPRLPSILRAQSPRGPPVDA